MKLKIKYPQIYFETKEIEVDEETGMGILEEGVYAKGDFIWENLTPSEQSSTFGIEMIYSALDNGYGKVTTD